jgi:AhpD family alkylhydroperoxidase
VRWKVDLDDRLREIVIVRVGYLNRCAYVVNQHVPELTAPAGLTKEQCHALADWRPSPLRTIGQTLIAGLCILLLRLAFTNHRSAETDATRVWRQSAVLVTYVAAALMINGLVALA